MKNSFWRGQSRLFFGLMMGVVFLSACTSEPVVSDEMKYYCETDLDCVNSCGYGAVNFSWFQGQEELCDDGCAGDRMAAPQCIENGCVAFREDGLPASNCTQQ
ncbi:MAG: hypothetical protein WCW30_05090 [Candidatus Gracilibacteria bacterium]